MKPPVLRPAAAADVEEAFGWYEGQRAGVGEEFLLAVQATLKLIAQQPRAYPVVHRDTRRALLKRFPYGLYYRLFADAIVVVGCFHGKRNPKVWKARR